KLKILISDSTEGAPGSEDGRARSIRLSAGYIRTRRSAEPGYVRDDIESRARATGIRPGARRPRSPSRANPQRGSKIEPASAPDWEGDVGRAAIERRTIVH